eukprot:6492140-Amphidinium_carterae.1
MAHCMGSRLAKVSDWALKRKLKNGQEIAEGDMCTSCWRVHSQHFNHMTWQQYCVALNEGEEKDIAQFKAFVADAQDKALNPDKKKQAWLPQAVSQTQSAVTELSKHYIALSQGDLKKVLGLRSITKGLLSTLPSIEVVNEQGLSECLYLFLDPEKPFRSLQVKALGSFNHSTHCLATDQQTWTQQATEVWKHNLVSKMKTDGVNALLHATSVMELGDFIEKQKQEKSTDENPLKAKASLDSLGNYDVDDEEDDIGELVGEASTSIQPIAPSGLLILASSGSMTSQAQTYTTPIKPRVSKAPSESGASVSQGRFAEDAATTISRARSEVEASLGGDPGELAEKPL